MNNKIFLIIIGGGGFRGGDRDGGYRGGRGGYGGGRGGKLKKILQLKIIYKKIIYNNKIKLLKS